MHGQLGIHPRQQAGDQRPDRWRLHEEGRIFAEDGNYAFDAAETEPTNTNSFYGSGGYVMWANDTSRPKR
jgi:hypothetical protein